MKIDKYGEMLHRTTDARRFEPIDWNGEEKSFAGLQQPSRKALFPSSQETGRGVH